MAVKESLVNASISDLESRIRDLINEPRTQYALLKKKDLWEQLCSSLDVMGDTELAIAAFTAQTMRSEKRSGVSPSSILLANP